MTIIEKLSMNVRQANSDFAAIKNKIIEKGVDVPDGTPTSDYGLKVDEVFEAGKQSQTGSTDRIRKMLLDTKDEPFELTEQDFEGVTIVPAYFMYAIGGLTSVTIGNSVRTIENMAFYSTSLKSLVLGNSVEAIGTHAFSGAQISVLTLPDSLVSIGVNAFFSCTKITSPIIIPENVANIGDTAFKWCNSFPTLTFKGTPSSIATNAFESCSALKNIYVPWAEGEVANAPWGATGVTIHYSSEV